MIGSNQLVLNEASMIEAVQEYLAKRITVETPQVSSVQWEGGDFKIMLTDGKVART